MEYSIEYFCVSHTGNIRTRNQDNFFCLNEYMPPDNNGSDGIIKGVTRSVDSHVFAVFDGMGGEECGEVAAYIAAKQMSEFNFENDSSLELLQYCKKVNNEICRYTADNSLISMGTTAAILMFARKKILLCNIGDSKIFRFTDGVLQQISYDHVSISAFGTKPPLTQNLGIKEDELIISPYTATGEYHNNDIYLICSDGLTDMVSNEDIENILNSSQKEDSANLLLHKALENGGKDNITFILLYICKDNKNIVKRIIESLKYRHGNN